jgi:hypothetical protein
MSAPVRIQRKRTKGWRMPEGAIYVGRPSKWGNLFIAPDPAVAVGAYRRWLTTRDTFWVAGQDDGLALAGSGLAGSGRVGFRRLNLPYLLPDLRGKDLACWCPLDQPCHADVLLELANGSAS